MFIGIYLQQEVNPLHNWDVNLVKMPNFINNYCIHSQQKKQLLT